MQKEYGKWRKERTNQKKKKESSKGWRVKGERKRVRMLTQQRTERRWRVKESKGGLLKNGKGKGDDGGGQEN